VRSVVAVGGTRFLGVEDRVGQFNPRTPPLAIQEPDLHLGPGDFIMELS
jgi:hypothetical protein